MTQFWRGLQGYRSYLIQGILFLAAVLGELGYLPSDTTRTLLALGGPILSGIMRTVTTTAPGVKP